MPKLEGAVWNVLTIAVLHIISHNNNRILQLWWRPSSVIIDTDIVLIQTHAHFVLYTSRNCAPCGILKFFQGPLDHDIKSHHLITWHSHWITIHLWTWCHVHVCCTQQQQILSGSWLAQHYPVYHSEMRFLLLLMSFWREQLMVSGIVRQKWRPVSRNQS